MVLKPRLSLSPLLSAESLGSPVLSKRQCLRRWTILGLCTAPLIGSFFYRYGYHLPFLSCPLRTLTGIPCPTCGMTRSFVAIAQGRLDQALGYHLFGPAVFLLFLTVAASLLWELKTNRNQTFFHRRYVAKPSVYLSTGLSYLGYYAVRIAHLARTGELSDTFWTSPMGHWISHVHFYVS
jgi:Protein of unknown function (DUF2752)